MSTIVMLYYLYGLKYTGKYRQKILLKEKGIRSLEAPLTRPHLL